MRAQQSGGDGGAAPPVSPGAAGRSPLAVLLRSLRAEAGVSLKAMASRLRISSRTLSHYELGTREPTHSVLEAYLAAIPGLDASRLLLAEDRFVAWSWPGAWPFLRDAFGYVVDEIHLSVRCEASRDEHEHLRLIGARTLASEHGGQEMLTILLRTACLVSPQRLRHVVAPPPGDENALRIEESDEQHVVTVRRDLACGLNYRRTSRLMQEPGAPARRMLGHDVVHPVETLRLRLELAEPPLPGMTPALTARPSVAGEDLSWDAANALHPDGAAIRASGNTLEATISRPLPGFRYSMGWQSAETADAPAAPRGGTMGERLKSIREVRNASLRDAATRMGGLNHVTIRNAEQGAEVAHATLLAYLEAFPDLSPHHLLPPPAGPADLDALWRHQRDVFGLCMGDLVKRVRVAPDGRSAITLRMSSVRRLHPSTEDFLLHHGGILGVFQASPHAISAITGAPGQIVVRGRVDSAGATHQVFRFQRHDAIRGLSFTVKHALSARPQFSLSLAGAVPVPSPGPHHEGTSQWVRFPCERLRISVSLPRGYRPRGVQGHVGPWRMPPDFELPPLSASLPFPVPVVRERNGVFTASIKVDRPLVGFKYGIAWQLT